jgi:hypothetical protein
VSRVLIEAITRFRGDTSAIPFVVRNARTGAVKNIAGASFRLTVNTEENPEDDSNELFALTGVITDEDFGRLQFAPTLEQADQAPGEYWYDIEMTEAGGGIETLAKAPWIVRQDISK